MTKFATVAAIIFCLGVAPATQAQEEIKAGLADRAALGLTVYNSGFGLVRDSRTVTLPQGLSRVAFIDIAGQIQPQTARLHAPELTVLEQNFDYDLLSPTALLLKNVGRTVGLVRTHPTTGEDKYEEGTLLAFVDNKAVFRIKDRIETVGNLSPYRFVFKDVPANLRERPTLSMLLDSPAAGRRTVELSYLTGGLSWSADYVAVLDQAEQNLDLKGWVTLVNDSGTAYAQAGLQLLAGEVQRIRERVAYREALPAAPAKMAAAPPEREELFDYHLYTFPRPVDVAEKQTKQLDLLTAERVPVTKEYLFDSGFDRREYRPGEAKQELKARVRLTFKNVKPALGLPLPAGIVRTHKRDSKGVLQFIGEDRISHLPEGREAVLSLGSAFDLTATRELLDYKKIYGQEMELAWRIKIYNAKESAVEARVAERIPGDWEMLQESQPHAKKAANLAVWQVKVPAKGETELRYRVRVK